MYIGMATGVLGGQRRLFHGTLLDNIPSVQHS